jgi:para-nitrobenzyl esterase
MGNGEPDTVSTDHDEPVVATEYGRVRGVKRGPITSFKGIPYAAAPVGALRWRAPREPESWGGELDASRFGAIAPQPLRPRAARRLPEPSEDCLSLNVYTPRLGAAGLPVMVWIHGGAYYLGSSADPLFDGSQIARHGNVVVVTFNYRIGALGYLDFSDFARPDAPFDSNLGQRDQLAALAWVQRNIAAFGGDPQKVTVFGESAGGGATTTLMATPSAAGLFRGAIVESAPVGSVYSREHARRFAAQFLQLVDVPETDAGRLRSLSVAELTSACDRLVRLNPSVDPGTIAVAPVVDGELVPEFPLTAFTDGTALRVPLIIGTNRNEAQLFRLMRSPILPTTVAGIEAMVANIGIEAALAIPSTYPRYPSRIAALHISTDAAFRMPTIWTASKHSVHTPTWVYEFDYVRPLLKTLGVGAIHGSELPYVWGTPPQFRLATIPLGAPKTSARVARRMQTRWLQFAHNLNPNSSQLEPDWPPYDLATRSTLMIDAVDQIVDDPRGELRRAWGEDVIAFR